MSAQLRETAQDVARLLWREHTVYRERSGGVVIRGEHVQRWISLAPAGGRDEILLRAGRILDGGTTAPARCEAVMPSAASGAELAAACRRLLADTAAGPDHRTGAPQGAPPRRGARGARRERRNRPRRPAGRRTRHTGFASALVLLCVAGVACYAVWGAAAFS
ncbi:hypothetical protein [Streptomyces sp. ODS05-4]|uniref:hypothetical protein n=1 Tax=Streptomyces sp. ODS05-4 TaxID=2944939 RepID=UPI002109EA4C|nr:hypothetical protein [Streptomyces sp. ODS05-4]